MSDHQYILLQKLIIQSLNDLQQSTDNINDKLHRMDLTLERNTNDLEEHMKRTAAIEASLHPVRSIYDWSLISGKAIGILALIVGIIGGVYKGIVIVLDLFRG